LLHLSAGEETQALDDANLKREKGNGLRQGSDLGR